MLFKKLINPPRSMFSPFLIFFKNLFYIRIQYFNTIFGRFTKFWKNWLTVENHTKKISNCCSKGGTILILTLQLNWQINIRGLGRMLELNVYVCKWRKLVIFCIITRSKYVFNNFRTVYTQGGIKARLQKSKILT